jgi:hypothetical protein
MTMPSKRSHRRAILARALQLALAAALLLAWQGALLHPLEHVDEHGHFVHLSGADGRDTRGENDGGDAPFNPSDKLGDALAAIAICVGAAPPVLIAGVAGSDLLAEHPSSQARSAPLLGYRSQAPPSLLL